MTLCCILICFHCLATFIPWATMLCASTAFVQHDIRSQPQLRTLVESSTVLLSCPISCIASQGEGAPMLAEFHCRILDGGNMPIVCFLLSLILSLHLRHHNIIQYCHSPSHSCSQFEIRTKREGEVVTVSKALPGDCIRELFPTASRVCRPMRAVRGN